MDENPTKRGSAAGPARTKKATSGSDDQMHLVDGEVTCDMCADSA